MPINFVLFLDRVPICEAHGLGTEHWDKDAAQAVIDKLVPGASLEKDLDYVSFFINWILWQQAFMDMYDVLRHPRFQTSFNLLDYINPAIENSGKISFSGARDFVKTFTGLATGPKTKIMEAIKTSVKHQFSSVSVWKSGLVGLGIAVGLEFVSSGILFAFGVIDGLQFCANVMYTAVLEGIKFLGLTFITAVLVPFLGIFAWVVNFLLGLAIDLILIVLDQMFGLKEFITGIMVNIMKLGVGVFLHLLDELVLVE